MAQNQRQQPQQGESKTNVGSKSTNLNENVETKKATDRRQDNLYNGVAADKAKTADRAETQDSPKIKH